MKLVNKIYFYYIRAVFALFFTNLFHFVNLQPFKWINSKANLALLMKMMIITLIFKWE